MVTVWSCVCASRRSETHWLCSTRVKAVSSAGMLVPNQRMNVSISPVTASWMVVKPAPSETRMQRTVPVMSAMAFSSSRYVPS